MKPKHHRAAETQRTHFRVFRVFRGSCCSHVSVLLPVICALFLFLFAATSAPAQTTVTLLDIRSPATADPPSTSLLTLNDAGDLWIKGHLYDYAFQSTITLDPAKKYWTLRDSTGKIIWALEVHNPATGISTGDLYSIGSFHGWMTNPSQSGDLLRFTNAAGSTVFALSASGNARANGSVPGISSAPPYQIPPPPSPLAPDPPPDPINLSQIDPDLDGLIIPLPQAQGRVYYGGNPQEDVTDISWRLPWDSTRKTWFDYWVFRGLRYQGNPGGNPVTYRKSIESAQFPGYIGDEDGLVYVYGGVVSLLYHYGDVGYWDPNWYPSAMPALPASRPANRIDMDITMTNPEVLPIPPYYYGWNSDDSASAKSRLYLYNFEFRHPDPPLIPRKTGDASVAIGCCLNPRDIVTTWTHHVQLTIWDPAYPNQGHKAIFTSPASPSGGQIWISTMWDGKLYENGVSGTAYYTQASDFFMEATVYWNVSNPQKLWESAGPDTFPEPRVAFTVTGSPAITSNTLEVGSQYTFSTVTNSLPAAIASYQWDFHGKAFQTADHDVYDSSHLLTSAQKATANVTTKFITGSKSLISNTDLGTRTVQLSVTDTSGTLWNSALRPYVMVHRANSVRAKITPYYVPYEINSYFTNSPMNTPLTVWDSETQTTTTYYFGSDFVEDFDRQGTVRPYRLRTQANLTKTTGTLPSAAQQYIFHGTHGPTFSSTVSVSSQDAARFQAAEHRSYYNAQSYKLTNIYHVASGGHPEQVYGTLGEYVNSRRSWFTQGDPPIAFQSSTVHIHDRGPFDHDPPIDEKHIDIFYQSSGETGINRDDLIAAYGQAWATVRLSE